MPGLGQLGQRGPALTRWPDVLAIVATDRTDGGRLVSVGVLDGTGGQIQSVIWSRYGP